MKQLKLMTELHVRTGVNLTNIVMSQRKIKENAHFVSVNKFL